MGNLKKWASSLTLNKRSDEQAEECLRQGALKRSNAKLHKRNKDASALGQIDEAFTPPSYSSSSINSFGSGASALDVDVLARHLATTRLAVHRLPSTESLTDRLGLQVNTSALHTWASESQSSSRSTLYGPSENSQNSSFGLTLAEPRSPGPRGQCPPKPVAHTHHERVRGARARTALGSLPWGFLTTGSSRSTPDPTPKEASGAADLSSAKPNGHLPAIRDIDWENFDDNHLRELATLYGVVNPWLASRIPGRQPPRPSSEISSAPSPVDSGLADEERDPGRYEGKGKGRVIDTLSPLQRFSQAMSQLRVQDKTVEATPGTVEAGRYPEDDGRPQCLTQNSHDDQELNMSDGEEAWRKAFALIDSATREHTQPGSESVAVSSLREQQIREDEEAARRLQQRLWLGNEREALVAAERAREQDCNVCGESKDPLDFDAAPPTARCEHPATTCQECLQSWMASQFETKGNEAVKCPECPQELDYSDVQRAASQETFLAYDRMSTRNALAALPDFAWCLAPNCDNGQLNVENSNYMDCAACGYKQCLRHKVPWHTGETCDQYEYRTSGQKAKDHDAATEKMLDDVSKKCPGPGCGCRIQKTHGCDHMTCKKCRWEFCWRVSAVEVPFTGTELGLTVYRSARRARRTSSGLETRRTRRRASSIRTIWTLRGRSMHIEQSLNMIVAIVLPHSPSKTVLRPGGSSRRVPLKARSAQRIA